MNFLEEEWLCQIIFEKTNQKHLRKYLYGEGQGHIFTIDLIFSGSTCHAKGSCIQWTLFLFFFLKVSESYCPDIYTSREHRLSLLCNFFQFIISLWFQSVLCQFGKYGDHKITYSLWVLNQYFNYKIITLLIAEVGRTMWQKTKPLKLGKYSLDIYPVFKIQNQCICGLNKPFYFIFWFYIFPLYLFML